MLLKRVKKAVNSQQDFTYNDAANINMELTYENLKSILGKSKDLNFRIIYTGTNKRIQVAAIYVDGMVDSSYISDYVLKPLIQEEELKKVSTENEALKLIKEGVIYFSSQKVRQNINDCINDILTGSIALVFDSEKTAVTFATRGFDKRPITEPSAENVIKGSKDTFVETIRVNTATIRRKIKSPNLVIEEITLGRQTLTPVAVVYMDNITNRHMIKEVKRRLENINVDNVLSIAFVEEFIIDKRLSAFPQIVYTERPDKYCSNIVEGRVGLIIDGIPSAIIIPGTFLQFLQAPEDYSQNFLIGSGIRLLRFILLITTLFLPGFYISITSFHQEMIPTELALSIQASKEGVPFPTFVEVFFMLAAFEILVEAGVRLPKSLGQAVSIVGAVVVGQAAVSAKLVSPAVVVIIAITAISSFTMPNQDMLNALMLWRFIIAICSSILGLFGLSIGAIILLHHLSSINVLGVPYLTPFAANEGEQLQDTLFRLPVSFFRKRPVSLKSKNEKRQE